LAFVARRIASARVLVVATVREEELSDASILSSVLDELAADPRVKRMTLPPLSREHTAALVRSLARADTDATAIARLADEIFASSRGNPFMVVETMRALADGTTIARATSPVLPERVRQVIASRIERLGEQSRNLLATASVIGRDLRPMIQRAVRVRPAPARGRARRGGRGRTDRNPRPPPRASRGRRTLRLRPRAGPRRRVWPAAAAAPRAASRGGGPG